jgi:hypothetical protein
VLVVVVVDDIGATGTVVDCSVVVVRVTLSELPQPATKAVPETSATAITNLRPDLMSVMGKLPVERISEKRFAAA